VKKLSISERISTLTLHLAKDAAGEDFGEALDSTATVGEALGGAVGKIRLIIRVAESSPPPAIRSE
jgi:hypothetical protein